MTVASRSATPAQSFSATSLFGVNDADGDPMAQYDLFDNGGGGGHFVVNGVVQKTSREIIVSAAQLAQTTYQSGTGVDTLWVRVNDGTDWSAWSSAFTITGSAASPPVVTVVNRTLNQGTALVAASSLFTATDPSGLAIAEYAFWNSGANGGHFVLNGTAEPSNSEIDVSAALLAQLQYQGAAGTDTLWVRASDGAEWSAWSTGFTVTTPTPTLTVSSDSSATKSQVISLSSLVTINDPASLGYQKLELWDSAGTVTGGRFVVGGAPQSGNQEIDISPGNLASTVFDAGNTIGTDTVWARLQLNDGSVTSWQQFTVTVPTPTLSVVARTNASSGQQISLSSLVTVLDPNSVGYQTLQLWDSNGTTAGGELKIAGAVQPASQIINVAPASIANTVFVAGSSVGSDTLWARLLQGDGSATAWQQIIVTVPNPTLSVTSANIATSGQALNLSSLITVSDPGHVGYQKLELWDSNGTAAGGRFVIGGTAQTGGHEIDVASANVSSVVFDAGTAAGTDTIWAQLLLNDGTTSGWQAISVTVPNPGLVVNASVNATTGQQLSLSSLFSITNSGAGYQKLELWDTNGTLAGGHFVVNGTAETGGHEIDVAPGTVASTVFDVGTSAGTDTLFVQLLLNDGTSTGWKQINLSATAAVVNNSAYTFSALNDPTATSYTLPLGISITGSVVGDYYNTDASLHAFSFSGAGGFSTFTLPALGVGGRGGFGSTSNVSLNGISNAGLLAGSYVNASGAQLSFYSAPDPNSISLGGGTVATILTSFSDSSATNGTFAMDVNDTSLLVGYYVAAGVNHGFSYNGTTASTIDMGTSTVATGVNNNGLIVGYFADASGTHGFLDNNGSFTTLNDPSAANFTEATGINSSGAIVGFYKDSSGVYHGFVDNGGTFTTIDDPSASASSGSGTKLNGVNDLGQMVGAYGNFSTSQGIQGFVVSPSTMTVANGGSLTLGTPFSGTVAFAGSTGALTLSDPADFHGSISGQLAVGDKIDLPEITAGSAATIGYSGNNSPGTLTVSDGTHSVSIALTGNYSLGNFTPSSDNNGGTIVVDPPLSTAPTQGVEIADGGAVEIDQPFAGNVDFAGSSGTLLLDNSSTFAGTVAGMLAGDAIDLADVSFAGVQAPAFAGDASGGALSVTDGTHGAVISMLGNYPASTFASSSDGHGGTLNSDVQIATTQRLA